MPTNRLVFERTKTPNLALADEAGQYPVNGTAGALLRNASAGEWIASRQLANCCSNGLRGRHCGLSFVRNYKDISDKIRVAATGPETIKASK